MILPIEWRSSLELDRGLTEQVTLPRMSHIREHLNSVAMDIIYYQSPLYRTEIITGVARCLNETYAKFMRNNPDFNGPVSILAHSLGSVIVYDILTQWTPFRIYDEYVSQAVNLYCQKERTTEEERLLLDTLRESREAIDKCAGLMDKVLVGEDSRLQFSVKNLFCIGSPLAVFIIMRGGTYRSAIPPKEQVERIFNIFHPYDPIAYRLEPLFHEKYRYVRPLKVYIHGHEFTKSYDDLDYTLHRAAKKRIKKEKGTSAKVGELVHFIV